MTVLLWCWLAQASEAVVSGTVVNSVTGAPVRDAEVQLMGGMTPRTPARTDDEGRYTFTGVAAGSYRVMARSKRVPSIRALKTVLNLGAEERREIVIALPPPAAVSGRIVDERGEPLMHAQAQVLRRDYSRGRLAWLPVRSASTDDRGEFRLHSLEAGRYRIVASDPQARERGYSPMYFPNASDAEQAATVRIAPGAEFRADFRLERGRAGATTEIRGRLAGAPANPRGMHVSALPIENPGHPFLNPAMSSEWQGEAQFVIRGLPPARYLLVASVHTRPGEDALNGTLAVDTRAGSVEGVTVPLTEGIEVSGRIRLEGELPKGVPAPSFRVLLNPGPRGVGGMSAQAEVGPEGRFRLPKAPPGVWDIQVMPMPAGLYLKSVKFGEVDVLRGEMELTAGAPAAELDIVLSARGATLSGTAKGAEASLPSAIVAVMEGPEAWLPGFPVYALTRPDGRFEVKGVRPGQYRVFALAQTETNGVWRDPAVWKLLEPKMLRLKVEEGGAHPGLEIPLLTAEEIAAAELEAP